MNTPTPYIPRNRLPRFVFVLTQGRTRALAEASPAPVVTQMLIDPYSLRVKEERLVPDEEAIQRTARLSTQVSLPRV